MSPERVLVVIATYNEIDSLPRLFVAIRGVLPEAELLVVDDNSPDGTGRWCDEQASVDARFHVLHRPGKQGLGSATILGLQYAVDQGYDVAITMDADQSHDPAYLPPLIRALDDPADDPVDLTIGSRYVPGGRIDGWPLHRRIMSRIINRYARWMLRLSVNDCSGAYRCFRVASLRKFPFTTARSAGYGLLEELLWLMRRHGLRAREIPIVFGDRALGRSKISMGEAWRAVFTIAQLALRR